jgi:hypothetical protein
MYQGHCSVVKVSPPLPTTQQTHNNSATLSLADNCQKQLLQQAATGSCLRTCQKTTQCRKHCSRTSTAKQNSPRVPNSTACLTPRLQHQKNSSHTYNTTHHCMHVALCSNSIACHITAAAARRTSPCEQPASLEDHPCSQ